jgi:hypothetical protein
MTGVVPGSGTGAGTVMLGVVSKGGVMTPSVRPSLSLSGSFRGNSASGSIFSGMLLRGSAGEGVSVPTCACTHVLATGSAEATSTVITTPQPKDRPPGPLRRAAMDTGRASGI